MMKLIKKLFTCNLYLNSIVLSALFLLTIHCFGQKVKKEEQKSFRELFTEAAYHLEFGNYNLALPVYLQMENMPPANANILYRIGLCYLNSPNEKSKAIPYLEKAVKSATKNYNDLAYTELNSPLISYYELAKAYHFNGQIDAAISIYNKYCSLLNPKHCKQEDVKRQITMCEYAKQQIDNPINVKITNMGANVNSQYADFCPLINADESMMIFTSRREGSTGGPDNLELDNTFFEDIYVTVSDSIKWDYPYQIGSSINTTDHDAAVGLSADGNRLFIYKDLDGGDIYQSFLMGDIWTVPEKLGSNINTEFWETHASITPDGKTLYFVSNRESKKGIQYGGRDIYSVNKLPNGEWSEAKNLGPVINTKYDEDGCFIHPSGKRLYFSSNGHKTMGGFDIFFSDLKEDGTWSEPINIGYPINTANDDLFYVEASNGKRAYYSSINPKLGLGEKDIYQVELLDREETPLTILSGIMAMKNPEGVPVNAQIIVKEPLSGKETVYQPNSSTGKFLVVLPPETDYNIKYFVGDSVIADENLVAAEGSGYHEIIKNIDLEGQVTTSDITIAQADKPEVPATAHVEPVIAKPLLTNEPIVVETKPLRKPEIEPTAEPVEKPAEKLNPTEKAPVKPFKHYFNYNAKQISKSEKDYMQFIEGVAASGKQGLKIVVEIEASASLVPTKTYGTNKALAQQRGLTTQTIILQSLIDLGVEEKNVDFKINPLVQGPAYNNDAVSNKANYEKYQYVFVSLK